MVPPEEYFYYLRRSFRTYRIKGYTVGKKRSGKTCMYEDNGKWVVAFVENGVAVDPKRFPIDHIWPACEEMINRLVPDKALREKVWMGWASPSNWAEKMAEPLKAFPVDPKTIESHKINR